MIPKGSASDPDQIRPFWSDLDLDTGSEEDLDPDTIVHMAIVNFPCTKYFHQIHHFPIDELRAPSQLTADKICSVYSSSRRKYSLTQLRGVGESGVNSCKV